MADPAVTLKKSKKEKKQEKLREKEKEKEEKKEKENLEKKEKQKEKEEKREKEKEERQREKEKQKEKEEKKDKHKDKDKDKEKDKEKDKDKDKEKDKDKDKERDKDREGEDKDPEDEFFRKTSDTHPIEVDYLPFEEMIELFQSEEIGSLGMSMCPGRNKKQWTRDLDKDLDRIANLFGADVVVSLVQMRELERMGIPHMFQSIRSYGLEHYHFPIRDKWIPSSMYGLVQIVNNILCLVQKGKRVVVHCNGGKGRAATICVSCLVAMGKDLETAITIVRKARSGTIRNPIQIMYIKRLRREFLNHKYNTNLNNANPSPFATSPQNSGHNPNLGSSSPMGFSPTTTVTTAGTPQYKEPKNASNTSNHDSYHDGSFEEMGHFEMDREGDGQYMTPPSPILTRESHPDREREFEKSDSKNLVVSPEDGDQAETHYNNNKNLNSSNNNNNNNNNNSPDNRKLTASSEEETDSDCQEDCDM